LHGGKREGLTRARVLLTRKEGPRPSPHENVLSFPECVNHLPPHIASLPVFRMSGILHNQRAKKMKQKKGTELHCLMRNNYGEILQKK
jgi:hypothetical protein